MAQDFTLEFCHWGFETYSHSNGHSNSAITNLEDDDRESLFFTKGHKRQKI